MAITVSSLITPTPEAGYQLAIQLAQKGVVTTQPSERIQQLLRPVYSTNADSLISVSRTIGIYYQIVAAANNYWRGRGRKPRTLRNSNRAGMNRSSTGTANNPGTTRRNTIRNRNGRRKNSAAAGNPVRRRNRSVAARNLVRRRNGSVAAGNPARRRNGVVATRSSGRKRRKCR